MCSQASTFGTDRVFGYLHYQRFAFMYQCTDRFDRRTFTVRDFRGMDEGSALKADIHERRLHTWQYADYLALIDIADDATAQSALNMHFLQHTVLNQCYPGFHRGDIDQDFFAHGLFRSSLGPRIPVLSAP